MFPVSRIGLQHIWILSNMRVLYFRREVSTIFTFFGRVFSLNNNEWKFQLMCFVTYAK